MKFAQKTHPTRLFGPTCLLGTWEYFYWNDFGNNLLIAIFFPTDDFSRPRFQFRLRQIIKSSWGEKSGVNEWKYSMTVITMF